MVGWQRVLSKPYVYPLDAATAAAERGGLTMAWIPTGFDFGMLRVERLIEVRGAVVVRVLNRASGKYVEVQTTAHGRRQYVTCGHFDRKTLARLLKA